MACGLVSAVLLPGYCAWPSGDLWSAFVRWLAAITDLRTAFPLEKSAGFHSVEPFT